jgi:Mrp family chromosome partitioning ATPase
MRNDMAKHIPQSLLERAAELYDFGAAIRAPAAAPAAAPEPKPEPAPKPQPVIVEAPAPAAKLPEPAPAAPVRIPRAVEASAAPARRAGAVAEIDRAALAAAGFIVPEGPVTGIAEEFRLIKHQLLADIAGASELRRRTLLVCSAQPRSGKTFCTINLALSLAGERDVEVLLIDGDFPKPDALPTLGIRADGPGFVDALADPDSDPEDYVVRTDLPGLSVLPAGRRTNNIPELLASERTREVLAKLDAGDRRRIILFDSPPALMASHATVLAGHVGRALVVVRADHTTEADLRETIGLLSGGCQISLILNGAGLAVTGRKFGSYDGYGHDQ